MIIFGNDLGWTTNSYAIIECNNNVKTVIDYGIIENLNSFELPRKINLMTKVYIDKFKEYTPDIVIYEKAYRLPNPNVQSKINFIEASLFIAVEQCKLADKLKFINNATVKKIIGKVGNASKNRIEAEVKKLLNIPEKLLNMPYNKKNHIIDSIAIALCYDKV